MKTTYACSPVTCANFQYSFFFAISKTLGEMTALTLLVNAFSFEFANIKGENNPDINNIEIQIVFIPVVFINASLI